MDRTELRHLMLDKIKSFPDKKKESEELVRRISSSREWLEAETVLAFCPLSSEPDISPLLGDKRILLPYIENGKMKFSSSHDLRKSKLGFLEPEHIEENYGNALMLVPLLGFNANYRLGRGGGFYDRYIRENKNKLYTAGVAFSVSFCPAFMPNEYDEKLDHIFSIEV